MLEAVAYDAVRSAIGPIGAAYALLAIGLNLHFGYTGLLNFGQVGFMLVGAYGVGITVATFGLSLWLGFVVALLAAVALALLLGVPTLRLRADYLAITTVAAAEILRFVARASDMRPLTGGSFGLQGLAGEFYAVNPLRETDYSILGLSVSHHRLWTMLVAWGLAVLLTALVWALIRSPWGRVVKSIREDEDAARSLGKNVFAYKMQSLVLGGVMGACAGMVVAVWFQTVQPDTFLPQVTFFAYTALILGGAASTFGPLVGAWMFWAVVTGLESFLGRAREVGIIPADLFSTEAIGAARLAFVGVLIIVLMIYRPQGMFGNRREMQLDVG